MTPVYDLPTVAQHLGVPPSRVRAWIASGELQAVNLSKRSDSRRPRLRVTANALEAFLAARTLTPAPTRSPKRQTPAPVYQRIFPES